MVVITSTKGRLSDLLQDLQAEAVDQAAEDAAEAAFDVSPEGERVHRYQAQWGRAMIQTLEAIRKLKRDAAMKAPAEEPVAAVAAVAPFVGQDSNPVDDFLSRDKIGILSHEAPAELMKRAVGKPEFRRLESAAEPTATAPAVSAGQSQPTAINGLSNKELQRDGRVRSDAGRPRSESGREAVAAVPTGEKPPRPSRRRITDHDLLVEGRDPFGKPPVLGFRAVVTP
jgi:hypothetical protein